MAILIEHVAGKFPFFISPRQIKVIPISEKFMDYCETIYLYFHRLGYEVELDKSDGKVDKKIRNAQLEQFNFMLVAGKNEMEAGTVNIRNRDSEDMKLMRVDEAAKYFESMMPAKSKSEEELY